MAARRSASSRSRRADGGDGPARPFDRARARRAAAASAWCCWSRSLLVGAAAGLFCVGRAQRRALYSGAARRARHGRRVLAVRARRRHPARRPAARPRSPLLKAVVDDAFDGIVVTDHERPRDLRQRRLSRPDRRRRRRRRAAGRAGVHRRSRTFRRRSTACSRRRARAAGCRKRCASPAHAGEAGALAAHARAPARRRASATPSMTVWSIADVTRERERQENVFQELQHAIDYLDHAPAGFFSVDGKGDIVYLNATLADWLDHDLAQVGSGGLKLADIVAGEGAALLTTLNAAPGEVKTEVLDLDLKTRGGKHGAGAAVPQGRVRRRRHARPLAHAGAQPRQRRRRRSRSAPRKCASCASSRTRRWRSRPSTRPAASRAPMRASPPPSRGCSRAERAARSSSVVAERDRAALEAAIRQAAEGQGDIAPVEAALAGAGERWASFFVSAVEEEERDGEAAIVYALETTAQRTLENQRQPAAEDGSRSASSPAASRTTSTTCCRAIMMATDFLLNAHKPTDPSFQDIMQIKQNANRAAAWCGSCWPSRASRPCGRRCSISARRCPTSPCCSSG